MATQPGYRPGFRVGGPGLADQQRAAKRASSDAPPSSDHLRARAELRAKLPKGGSRGSSSAFAPSPEASGDEAEDPNTRVVTVGKISAQFVLPPASSVPEEKPPPEIGAALPHALTHFCTQSCTQPYTHTHCSTHCFLWFDFSCSSISFSFF